MLHVSTPTYHPQGVYFKTNAHKSNVGRDSSVGIATGYGLDGPGIESRLGARFYAPVQTGPWGPPSLLYNGYRVFRGVKSGRSVTLTPHPLLVPLDMKE